MPKGTPTPADVKAQIVAAAERGENSRAIAARLGLRYETVWGLRKQAGLTGPHLRFTDEEAMALRVEHEGGMSVIDLAADRGVKYRTVRDAIIRASGSPRTREDVCRLRRLHILDEAYFSCIDTEEKAYILGFHAADGHCEESQWLRIALQRRDRGHLEKIRAALKSTAPIRDYVQRLRGKEYLMSSVKFCSDRLAADLAALGLGGRKVDRVRPWEGPDRLMRHWWRGVVDGDGHVSCGNNKGKRRYAVGLCGTEAMARGFASFAVEHANVHCGVAPRGSIWTAIVAGVWQAQRVATLLYGGATIYLDRKKESADNLLAVQPARLNLGDLTGEDIDALLREHGSYRAAAEILGTTEASLRQTRIRRRRWGGQGREGETCDRPPRPGYRWDGLTADQLAAIYQEEGSWKGVGKRLGIESGNLATIKRRLGMSVRPMGRFAHLTAEVLADLKARHGSWAAAARTLGMQPPEIHYYRRRLGLL